MAVSLNLNNLAQQIATVPGENVQRFSEARRGVRDERRQTGLDTAAQISRGLVDTRNQQLIAQGEIEAQKQTDLDENIRKASIGVDVGRTMTTFLTLDSGFLQDREGDQVDGFKEFINVARGKVANPGLTPEQKKPWQKALEAMISTDREELRALATGHFQNIEFLIANAPETVPDLIAKKERREDLRKAAKPVSVARTSRLVNPVTGEEIVAAQDDPARTATPSQTQAFIKAASKLPSLDEANQFLSEQTSAFPELFPTSPSFKSQEEFTRAKAAFKTGGTGTRTEIGPDGQIIFTTGVDPNLTTIGRLTKEQGMLAQDRMLLAEVEGIEQQIAALTTPEAAFGVKGAVLDSTIVGILNDLPLTKEITVEFLSTALGDRVKSEDIPKIKEVRSSMAKLRRGMIDAAKGVQDDARATTNEFNLASQIVRGLEAKDDFSAVQQNLANIKRLLRIRSRSQTINQLTSEEQSRLEFLQKKARGGG